MAENELLDPWDGRRWRKWLSKIESDEPAEEIAEEGKRCLVGIFKKLVGWIPLEEFLDAARRGDDAHVRLVAETMHARIVGASAPQ